MGDHSRDDGRGREEGASPSRAPRPSRVILHAHSRGPAQSAEDVAMGEASSTAPRFEIKKWNAVCMCVSGSHGARARAACSRTSRARRERGPLAWTDRETQNPSSRSPASWGIRRWSWDICADTCAICRNSLNEPSIEYQANPSPNNENGLSIAFGCCGRASRSRFIARLLCPRISVTRGARSPPQTCSIWTASSAGSRPAPCAHSATKSGSSQRSSGSRDTDHSAETPAARATERTLERAPAMALGLGGLSVAPPWFTWRCLPSTAPVTPHPRVSP